MDSKKIIKLLNAEEGPKLDFKEELNLKQESSRKELAKDICAIANSRGGRGYLIIGIKDKTKEIIGIEEDQIIEEKIQQIISSRIEPPIPIKFEYINMEVGKIGVITIFQSDQKPYQFKETGTFYIRRGSTTDIMRKQELITMISDNLNLNIELYPIVGSSIEVLDLKLVDEYFKFHGIESTDENRVFLMESTSIIKKNKEKEGYWITLGGLLVFSKINNLFLPHNKIRILNNIDEKKDKNIFISGDLLSMLYDSKKVLSEILGPNYPVNAVFESVKNAIMYRDYTMFDRNIDVILNKNSITVASPGSLLKDKENENFSFKYLRRNMWIYDKLIALDREKIFTSRASGFYLMKKSFKGKGKIKFINNCNENSFKVIFPGIN